MKQCNNMYFFLLSIFCSSHLHAVIVGSNESVSVQSHVNFPAADTDNIIKRFALMEKGFSLQDASTTCTFDSIYPVSGALALNGGTLILNKDIVALDNISLGSFGTIMGNGRNIDLTKAVISPIAPFGSRVLQDLNLYISGQASIVSTLHIKGNCSIVGSNNTVLHLVEGIGFIIIEPGATLTIRDVTLTNVHGNNMRCVDNTGTIILDSSQVIQSDDYSFSNGRFSFLDTVDWRGTFTFTYDSTQSSTIQSESQLHLLEGLTFSMGRAADAAPVEPLVFIDQTSVLHLDDATLNITSHGARITKGRFEVSNIAMIEVNSTSTATALEFGDGITADDMVFHFNAGSLTDFHSGLVVFNTTQFSLINPQGGTITIRQSDQSINRFEQNYVVTDVIFDPFPLSQIEVAPGKTLSVDHMTVLTANGGSYTVTGIFEVGIGWLLLGNESMLINSGSLPVAILVANQNNFMGGAGSVTLPIILSDVNAELTWALTGQLQTDLFLNGGSLSLASDMNLGHVVHLVETGTVHLNNFTLNTGIVDYDRGVGFNNAIYWDGGPNSGAINMLASIELDQVWTFSGQNLINGNSNFLDLTGGALVIEKGSLLELRNLTVLGLSGNNIQCLDDEGRLILHNVSWIQDGDFMYTTGTLILQGNTSFQGASGNIFTYQSDAPAIIRAFSTITFDSGFTFSYDTTSTDLLQFTDDTSILQLNSATLHAAGQGLNLSLGILQVQGNSFLSSDTFVTFGDCFTGTNDMLVEIFSNGQLEITKGDLNYKNVNVASWNMQSTSILRTDGGAALNLYQILNLGTGSAVFGNNATLGNPENLIGSSSQEGTLNTVVLPPC